jgi:Fic family protein
VSKDPQKDPQKTRFYDHPSDLEPMLVIVTPELSEKAIQLIAESNALTGRLHPNIRHTVSQNIRWMNSYYSNLIEGVRTRPADIQAAIYNQLSHKSEDTKKKILLLKAHYETESNHKIGHQTDNIYSAQFACLAHKELFKYPETHQSNLTPGKLRSVNVHVGRHLAPHYESLSALMKRFEEVYTRATTTRNRVDNLIQTLVAHHRFTFIHPFEDGNGRVARFILNAGLKKVGVDGAGLWTITRGLARHKDQYFKALDHADAKRMNDYDGRGPRSLRALQEFCKVLLEISIDQVRFMNQILELPGLTQRVRDFCLRMEGTDVLPRNSHKVILATLTQGEVLRGEVPFLLGKKERTANHVIAHLLNVGIIHSASPKGKLLFANPLAAASSYFPELYPAGSLELKPIR